MAITATITKPLEPGFVQVDATNKRGYTRYFKVPQKNAKKFASEYTKQDKELNLYSNITFFSAVFAGVIGVSFFTKKMDSKLMQFLTQTAAGIGLGSISSLIFDKFADNEEKILLANNKVKEIYYKA